MLQTLNSLLSQARDNAASFCRNRRGVAAVEFALVAPILMALYFVTMEVSQGIESNKKVSRAAAMIGDLVAQEQGVNKDDLAKIMQIGQAIIYPYNRTNPSIEITGIQISNENNPKATVAWSRKMVNNAVSPGLAKKATVTVPDKLKLRDTFLIQVTTSLDYRPLITWAADAKTSMGLTASFDSIQMSETYFLRPRTSNTVDCSDC